MEFLWSKINRADGGWEQDGESNARDHGSGLVDLCRIPHWVVSDHFGGQFFEQHEQINSSHRLQVMNYCHGGKVLSSGGRGMGCPVMLQQKTCQTPFQGLPALSV